MGYCNEQTQIVYPTVAWMRLWELNRIIHKIINNRDHNVESTYGSDVYIRSLFVINFYNN